MRFRRRAGLWVIMVAAPLLLVEGPRPAEAQDAQGNTAALVRQKIDEVLDILRDPALRGREHREERHQKILAVANTIFGWDEMAQRSLGVYWRQASPAQRQRFVELFRQVLANYYLDQMDNFAGSERVTVQGSSGGADQQVVKTMITTRSREQTPVNYYLDRGPSGWRVYDVSVEGISLVENYRSRFRQYLVNHSFDELLTHLSGIVGKSGPSRRAGQPSPGSG